MSINDNIEFKNAIRDIALNAHNLDSPFDRVRCVEWTRKLSSLPDDDLEMCKIRNEYAQLLRIQVRHNFLHSPFINPPPQQSNGKPNQLTPMAECLGQLIAKEIEILPKCGPIAPVIHHKSPDGRAYISIKQIPDGGVLCYMAVSPDGLN